MKARLGFIAIILLFVISPAVAWLIHAGLIDVDIMPGQGKNHGVLIHPARPLDGLQLMDETGQMIDINHFTGQWTMLQFVSAGCDEHCFRNIYKMRNIRLAIGKDAHRVQRVVVTDGEVDLDKVSRDNPGTAWFQLNENSQWLLEQFPDYPGGDISQISGRIYIIDPQANLMMRYPHNIGPAAVHKDLKQLLKATWIRPRNPVD